MFHVISWFYWLMAITVGPPNYGIRRALSALSAMTGWDNDIIRQTLSTAAILLKVRVKVNNLLSQSSHMYM
jgi:hypothetical protein